MVPDQEVGSSNTFAQTTFISRSHIDLHHNFFELFNAQNLSQLVKQRLLFLGGNCETKPLSLG